MRCMLLVLILVLCTTSLHASEPRVELNIGVITTHTDEDRDLNEDNEFVGLSLKTPLFGMDRFFMGAEAATFINSYNTRSYTGGLVNELHLVDGNFFDTSVGLSYGLVYGYTENQFDNTFVEEKTMLYTIPYMTITYKNKFGYAFRFVDSVINHAVMFRYRF